ncbi:MAG: glycosyltransferase family 4 protein [Rickettsiales bacterium]|nr:glycosyltransferase family 4 protein [Pseudomonadota bacterium]MDA0966212.1 glycosyltransferase family 4 protein [Pseudomonadota bacterium]MDG4543123.1 glycosyltransferase family 4 protein [Rickettsiales bacterium]MDG4545321.1 glycosyltransferase family 4 protein [Rickettsiales bacterium]MDG4547770.1 glycosyltransferase family 4 protein [Rickettsiales bacterium]
MHVVNAMFSRGLGGIEQAFIDYCTCLKNQGCKVTAIIHPNAQVRPALVGLQVNIVNVKNKGIFDFLAKSYLKKILKQIKPDVIIVHGNRAAILLRSPAQKLKLPIVGVTHNYSLKRQIGFSAMFATTEDLKSTLISMGQKEDTIYKIPNMIKMPSSEVAISEFKVPVVIGTMGRFVQKKGFDFFVRSLSELKDRAVDFKAVIGGTGEEEPILKKLVKDLHLDDRVQFLGWVENKSKFFNNIDIFVLPSIHEPFGIILLEAFARGKAVITTDSEGPAEIATQKKDAIIVEKGDSRMIASAVEKLLNDRALARKLAENAYKTAQKYESEVIGRKILEALIKIEKGHK